MNVILQGLQAQAVVTQGYVAAEPGIPAPPPGLYRRWLAVDDGREWVAVDPERKWVVKG